MATALILAAPAAAETTLSPPGTATPMKVDVHEGTSMSVAVSPDGQSLAVDLQGSLWIIPAKGGEAKRITDYFNDARQPVWAPDGKTLAFFSYRDGNYDLYTIEPDGSNMRHVTNGLADDREPAWSPDGKQLAFSSDRAGSGPAGYNIWSVDVATGVVRQLTSDAYEDRLPSWSPDGKEIAYSSQRGSATGIYAVSITDGRERAVKEGPGTFTAPSWSPTGQLAYVSSSSTASRLEVDGTAVSGDENVFPFRTSWLAGSGAYFYVSDGKIRRRTGRREQTIPFTATLEVTRPAYVRAKRDWDSTAPRRAVGILKPTLSPDGKNIAFIALGDLYIAPIAGGKPENLTNDHAMDTDPSWSPDGSKIAYTSDKSGGLGQIWIRDLKTGEARQLTNIDTQPLGAAWSPDGKRIAFIDVDGRWGVAGLAMIDIESGALTRLQKSLPQPGEPSWSADGKYVAITLSKLMSRSFREGTNQVYIVPTDGVGQPMWKEPDPNVSIDTRGGGGPAWSPDGTKMAAIYEGLLKIWPVAADGTPLGPPRSYNDEISHYPSWSGDAKTILYQNADKLKTIDVETGVIREVPLDLTYTLAKPAGRTIIHVSALVDAVRDETQRDKDIVIEGNRIVEIRDHDPAVHADARYIDGTGLTAIPGLIEHHSHSQKDFGAAGHRAWLAYGITTVRDPGNQVYSGVEDREAQEAGVRIGPRMYENGPLLEWQRVYYKMGVAVAGPAHLERELERAKLLKYDVLKSYVRMPDIYQRRIVEAAHDMGVPVTGHEIYPAAYTGVDATEHTGATSRRGYSPKQAPLGRAYDDVVKLFGKSGRTLTPTLFGSLGPYLARNPDYQSDPRVALYPKWAQQSVTGTDPMAAALGPALRGSLKLVKDAFDAGALITAGTDTLIATNLHSEIAAYVDAGLTPFQALQTATVNAAKSLNLDAGTLEPGKLADIVLIEGDPRENIAATFKVRRVIINGVAYDEADLLKAPAD
ncbi:amidohydrolase family protein [Sphingobium sp. B8D3D]|uniref:amidohydrolase family protein n=1 Tax=Sphingobium sp. B8D3D TaxID=2940587 RepID=UPI0022247FFE|nr:amidohydrolase family protein [Sphingobium sp. B8D3D]MCW2414371.1 Tol biopolymer transport system component/imidazolonepropionase-like amidohydrolase [Sphingobium sp. B8D3A]